MRYSVSGLVLRPGEALERLAGMAADRLGVDPGAIQGWKVLRRSLDARGRGEPRFICAVGVEVAPDVPVPDLPGVSVWERVCERLGTVAVLPPERPLVIGAGPAGLFAALRLCAYGLRPILLERGKPVEERVRDVARYWRRGELDPESNVQFGEGGAGAFSDGKLTYRGKDGRKVWVFERLVECGAPPEILFDARPHLGTDRLRAILRRLRDRLREQGADVLFQARVDRLLLEGGRAVGVEHPGGRTRGSPVFLAPGHSARELYGSLAAQGVALEAKGFAMGARVELLQEDLDACQYGRWAGQAGLPPAEFAVKARAPSGRDAYSFCMCPGGVVIPAGTETDGAVVNGMSGSGRRGPRANAALVVGVGPEDFAGDPLAGLDWQGQVERRARGVAGYGRAPGQNVADFLARRRSGSLPRSSCPWPLTPAALDDCLPPAICLALREALPALIRQLPPLAKGLLIGVESRTSGPVRIVRGDDLQSPTVRGLYPLGEGAGYAGGIVSAAVDGLRAADAYAAALGCGPEATAVPAGGRGVEGVDGSVGIP